MGQKGKNATLVKPKFLACNAFIVDLLVGVKPLKAAVLKELFTFLTGSVKGPHTNSVWIKVFLLLLETLKQ